MEICNSLSLRGSVKQSLIILGKPPQVSRPISTTCNQVTAKKQRKSNFSVPASIFTENVGILLGYLWQKTRKMWSMFPKEDWSAALFQILCLQSTSMYKS